MTHCITRRSFNLGLAAALATPAATRAQAWPAKPIRLIVPYPPGGFTDVTARLVGQRLAEHLGQPVVIDNKPGANGTLGVDALAKAPADGHTFAMVIAAHAANTSLYARLPYDPSRDLAAVSLIGISPLVAAVNGDAPFGTLPELIAYARRHPGALSFGSSGIGSAAHLTTELLKSVAQIDMVHVPYRGAAAALADLMGGRIQLQLDAAQGLIQPGRDGRVRLIGVAADRRLPMLPGVPTFFEQGVALSGSTWAGMLASGRTAPSLLQRVADVVARIVRQDDFQARLQAMGTLPVGSTPEAFEAFIAAETAKWKSVIHTAGITLE
jgi:tripartite-type tricarboxylate transporter receptor subunit TctC